MGDKNKNRPKLILFLIILWILLATIFAVWGVYSFAFVVYLIPNWPASGWFVIDPMFYFGTLNSFLTWFFFGFLCVICTYGALKRKKWAWTTGIIISTVTVIQLSLMLASFMITAIAFPNLFSVIGLITVVIALFIDIGIVFYITRPAVKMYFEVEGLYT
jgi:hypothetical protein